jgi:hypothetical protein
LALKERFVAEGLFTVSIEVAEHLVEYARSCGKQDRIMQRVCAQLTHQAVTFIGEQIADHRPYGVQHRPIKDEGMPDLMTRIYSIRGAIILLFGEDTKVGEYCLILPPELEEVGARAGMLAHAWVCDTQGRAFTRAHRWKGRQIWQRTA